MTNEKEDLVHEVAGILAQVREITFRLESLLVKLNGEKPKKENGKIVKS